MAINMERFEEYFQRADLDRDGRISGAEAVCFLQGSNLSRQVLAQVWAYAHQNQTGFLSRLEFYNALKLVTVAQSNRELTPNIVRAALYSPASSKIPPPQIKMANKSLPQTNTEQAQVPWPKMTFDAVRKYENIFLIVDTDRDGEITGDQARGLFLSWSLPREVLMHIWELSDQDHDGKLSLREFCIALYFMERYREGRQLPSTLPISVGLDETLSSLAGPPTSGLRPQQNVHGARPVTPVGITPSLMQPAVVSQSCELEKPNRKNDEGPSIYHFYATLLKNVKAKNFTGNQNY